jgi:hypothetical protein
MNDKSFTGVQPVEPNQIPRNQKSNMPCGSSLVGIGRACKARTEDGGDELVVGSGWS